MFYLNQNDMDDLFREASGNYRLDTDAAYDWDKINRSLHQSPDGVDNVEPEKKKKRRFIFWYLLFIPLGWLGHYEWTSHFENSQLKQSTMQQNIAPVNSTEKETNMADNAIEKKQELQDEDVTHVSKNKSSKKIETIAVANPVSIAKNNHFSLPYTKEKTASGNIQKSSENTGQKVIAVNKDNKIISDNLSGYPDKTNTLNGSRDLSKTPVADSLQHTTADAANTCNKNKQTVNKTVAAKKPVTVKTKQSGFYAGVIFAPDLTTIKLQRTNGIGKGFGLIAGYKFNTRWSIETGVLSDKKKYYTKGEYFSKEQVPYLNNTDLVSVDGNCNMTEIPINVRYTFRTNKNGSYTASLGTSSYFMKEEYYSYLINVNGTNEEYDHTYYPSSKNYLAVINLTVAYEKKIGKSFSFRAEPYIKIPLTGIGTGNLPLSGAGINIGVIKSFH